MFGKMPPASAVRRAWWGTVVLFLVHGLVVSTWLSRIPAVQAALRLSNGILGLTLLSSAVGAVSSIPLTGWLVNRYGSKTISVAASLLFCLTPLPLGLAFNTFTLALALFIFGALAAAMDVSMNSQGVEVEKALGQPTMSRFHGMFSLGGMIGAGIGGFVAAHGVHVVPHFTVSALVNFIGTALAARLLLETHAALTHDHRLPLRKMPRVLFALSAIGFCILLSEGAMGDWTAVYLKQVLHAGAGTAAAGYAVFSAAMAIFRFLGDLITARLGPMRTVRIGSLVAAVGLVWALVMPSAILSLPGFAAAGAGFSVIIPLVFGSGGRIPGIPPGPGIATVTGIGYVGFIVGPPAIGFAAQLSNLRYGLCIVVACCIASALLSRSMQALEPVQPVEHAPELHF
jgi:hypothetical protein